MLNSMINPDLSGKNTNLVFGFMLIMLIAMSTNLLATNYQVSGAGSSEVNGLYVENGTNYGKPKYEYFNSVNNTTYYLAYDSNYGTYWFIGESLDILGSLYYSVSTSDTPPSTGWVDLNGSLPTPSVSLVVPILLYNTGVFNESTANDGSIANSITITLSNPEGMTFSGNNGTFSSSNYTSANVPSGLTLVITKNSDTELQVNLSGNASSHANNDDVNDLNITFLDAAFNGGTAADVSNSSKNDLFVEYYYVIATLADLQTLSNTPADWYGPIIQTADIDASGTLSWNGGAGFSPIGSSTTNFTGSYDGDGYSINNLYINQTSNDYNGFFGYLYNADIDNINLTDVDISGNNQTGGLAGLIDYGTIDNCFVSGSITGTDNSGGFAGDIQHRAVLNYCSAQVTVTGAMNVGGFAGRIYNTDDNDNNKPQITDSYAKGNVTASLRNIGGFVGWNTGLISKCYATGSATGTNSTESRIGGFAGAIAFDVGSTGKIDNCYSLGTVHTYGYNNSYYHAIGGFVGIYYGGGSITNCYSTGYVYPTTNDNYGGFCGLFNQGTSVGNYYDTDISQCNDTKANVHPKTTREMNIEGTYENWDFMDENINGTENIWGISPLHNDGYPFLASQGYDQYAEAPGGSGTEASPYQISSVANLFWLTQKSQYWDKYYEQSQNIDAAVAAAWYDDAGFLPIGNENVGFAGHYEGNEHTISNLIIDRSEENYIGLFGHLEGATVENLNLITNISGNASVGTLAGQTNSASVINYCNSAGTIEGSSVGGLIGINSSSEVKYCSNEATVNANQNAGGLIGQNAGTVKYCYNSGNITGTAQYIGGLIGYNGSIVNNCYNVGRVEGYDYVGGLMGYGNASYGYNAGSVVCSQSHRGGITGGSYSSTTSCYYDKNASGQSSDPGYSHDLTTMQMQMEYQYRAEESYQSDWDFMGETANGTDDIWGISPIVNDGYPFLSWQGYELYATEPDGSGTEVEPYIVDDMSDLYWISQKTDRWNDTYVQSCNIDAAGTYNWCGGSGFLSIGSGDANHEFAGAYNGQGYVISNLKIIRENEYRVGFVGESDASGQSIQNLGLSNAFIKGYKYVGGFVGFANGSDAISNCYISGSLIAINDYAGGIIGYNIGTELNNCYSHSSVSGNNYVGGLIGGLFYEYVTNCYSKGHVTGNQYTGGLIGDGANYVSNSFWDTQTSGQSSSAGGIGKTTAEMKTQSTFTNAGWDFNTIWSINSPNNSDYPYLQWQTFPTPGLWTGTTSTAWNTVTNWDDGNLPTSGVNVVIPSGGNQPVIGSGIGASCNDLTVNNGATLTLESGGSLITNGSITNNGTFNAERSISNGQWHLISSPITNAQSGLFAGDYLQEWDEATHNWSDISSTTDVLTPAKGFGFWSDGTGSTTHTFTGTPNTGGQSQDLTFTEYSSDPDDAEGANLLGNPYPSSIDWALLDGAENGAVYCYNGTAYLNWNNGSGTGSQYIAPMQGFFIIASSAGTFNVDNSDRVHNGATNYYKSTNTVSNGLVLMASNGSYEDELWIAFDEETGPQFDYANDAYKFLSNTSGIAQIYSITDDQNLSIDIRPETNAVQLGFNNDQNGVYQIGLTQIEGIASAVLEDTKNEVFHNLQSSNYHFTW
ncbi:MAG: GLUG motif-containing protein, partial [Bacteroidota bacterium]|nr:GLUG motif-containing protein [Bacteroidota bacterium]